MRTALKQTERYFERLGFKPFRFQRSVWKAYREGDSGLLHSATGTGKTLAAWMGPLQTWMAEQPDGGKYSTRRWPPLRTIWITPLRALANDTLEALKAPVEHLGLPWRVEGRTGDTSSSTKSRQLKRLPTALVTTPESLSLMLTHRPVLDQLRGLESIFVDEWHELLGTKRGVQTELALARLRRLNPNLRTWGISATLGNLDEACSTLLGDSPRAGRVIEGYKSKRIVFESLIPDQMDCFPWTGHIGTKMIPQVIEQIEKCSSALVFTNTRSQTEIWYQEMLKARPDWAGLIAVHHGSLDTSVRTWVENGLRSGKLRAVVCTSSLDLGVDFTAVDVVFQVGSPKGAARLLQRAGRSGHQPSATSRLFFVPTNAIELIELAAAQDAIRLRQLEARRPLSRPLDVLAQHAVTIAIGGGFTADELLAEVRSTRSFDALSDAQWQWVLKFVTTGGESLKAYAEFQKVLVDDARYTMDDRRLVRQHRMSIGTIASDAAMHVRYMSGRSLGTTEESFIAKLNEGDKFLFAGRIVKLVKIHDNAAYVRRATGRPDAIPRWGGGRLPISTELSDALRNRIERASEGVLEGREMRSLESLFAIQESWSHIPHSSELLVESIKTREGYHTSIFPFEGRLAHEGLGAVFAYRISQLSKITLTLACNDHGILLHSRQPIPIDEAIDAGLFSPENLDADIANSLNATQMAKKQFRQIARVAGLVHDGMPGQQKTAKQLRASSNMFYEVFEKYDPSNLLLEQSRREVLEFQLESARMHAALERIENGTIVRQRPAKMTPFSFPLFVDRLRERVSSESLSERVARIVGKLSK
ncbi:MAG TPA: ligase-associated DNA damage response DEXH box helicase [Planctomycetaceae bacterium]|nr:ligase-associated DNA damage response DEXH box helicase [Planctomycetaceae bacterium]